MPVTQESMGGVPHYTHQLATLVRLNLTAGRWQIPDGFASRLIGLDVAAPFELRPSRRRRPLEGLVPDEDLPLSWAVGFDLSAQVLHRVAGVLALQGAYNLPVQTVYRASGTAYTTATGVVDDTSTLVPPDSYAPSGSGDTNAKSGDYFYCHKPIEMRGLHKIIAKSNSTTFTIAPGLTAADVVGPNLEGVIVSGRQWMTTVNLPSASAQLYMVPSRRLLPTVPDEALGAILNHNTDRRLSLQGFTLRVRTVGGFAVPNDSLGVNLDIDGLDDSKVSLVMQLSGDLRGVILTNGRKFWKHQDETITLLLDLGSDEYLGIKWRMTPIAINRVLLTSGGHVPRVLHLYRQSPDLVVPDEVYAGCVPPQKPSSVEQLFDDARLNASWIARKTAGANGDNTAGTIKALVRGINIVDGLASAFVPVGRSTSLTVIPTLSEGVTGQFLDIDTDAGEAVSVFTQINQEDTLSGSTATTGFTPPIHTRMTHIEVWRTQAGAASNFYLESRMEIVEHEQGNELINGSTGDACRGWFNRTPVVYPVRLSDTDLISLPVLTDSERLGGGLPPICQDAVSLLGVTLCFGKAESMPEQAIVYARNFFTTNAEFNLTTGLVTLYGPNRANPATSDDWDAYVFQTGDQLVVTYTGPDAPQVSIGVYEIASNVADAVTLLDPPYGTGVLSGVHCHIRRPYPIDWPRIESDEDVWYSRTDANAPESFPPRTKRLSSTGDTFKRALSVNDTAVAVMEKGVHVLYLAGGDIQTETIAVSGAGTPWADSVVAVGRSVLWADSEGIRQLVTYADRNQDGQKAVLNRIEDQNFEPFFRTALDEGYNIDAGFDTRREIVRFRRTKAGEQVLVLVGSFRTGKWTLEEEDEGLAYASSAYTEADRQIPALHTVEARTGRLMVLHDDRTGHPYDGYTTTDVMTSDYEVSPVSIKHKTLGVFTPLMVGDVIAFEDAGVTRVILSATDRMLTFDNVPGLDENDVFDIGRPRFLMRPAPLAGSDPQATHTMYAAVARIRTGPAREDSGEGMDIRLYRDYEDAVVTEAVIPIFDSGRPSNERIPLLDGEGHALEVELSTRDDFTLEHLSFTVREEGGGHPGPLAEAT